MSKSAWLISGGALKGAFDLPILEHLISAHGYPDVIAGVSVGAVNGSAVACGKLDAAYKIWLGIDDRSPIFGIKGFMRPTWLQNRGLYTWKPLLKHLRKHIHVEDLKCEFQAGWMSRNEGSYYQTSFTSESGCSDAWLHRHILASASIAPFHEPWRIKRDGKSHLGTDGGHLHPLPRIPWDVTTVFAIFHRAGEIEPKPTSEVDGLIEAAQWAVETQMSAQAMADYNELVHWASHGANRAVIYMPEQSLGGMFDARKETIRARIEAGKEACENPIIL